MIHYIKQDITAVTRGIVAHGCNCQGVMGSGVAGAIKRKWPEAYNRYSELCRLMKLEHIHEHALGCIQLVEIDNDLVVANMFTQVNYGRDERKYASPWAIERALRFLMDREDGQEFSKHLAGVGWNRHIITLPVYMPKVGCGLGGLDWDSEVRPIVKEMGEKFPNTDLYICDL
jgi:hypothetical protein